MRLLFIVLAALSLVAATHAFAAGDMSTPVTITETDDAYTLANGVVTATVAKRTADLTSLKYHDLELLNPERRHPGAYWSHSPASEQMERRVTIDPKTNGGAIGEVSIKGI